ncbi:WD repeat-containing protein 55 homolog [Caerostris extrusa]|uniref:WD repeat-containing protein 55 homolog n=1 Tax=Caerostris extrusa TaxID=172846 RepID=A0AAV4P6D7_CAEEX|nr:WD repeat-containing protein 55 homolog [Caerostris extrusa]
MMWKPSIKVVQEQVVTEKTTFYDMEKDVSQPHVLAACQDSKIRIYVTYPQGSTSAPCPALRERAHSSRLLWTLRVPM